MPSNNVSAGVQDYNGTQVMVEKSGNHIILTVKASGSQHTVEAWATLTASQSRLLAMLLTEYADDIEPPKHYELLTELRNKGVI